MQTQYSPRITELEAQNVLLAAIGASPITNTDSLSNVDAISARAALISALREIQMEKWYFNTEEDYPLSATDNKEIYIPSSIISIDYIGRYGEHRNIAIRGNRLYDLTNHTYTFDDTIHVNVHLSLEFDELPETAKQYVIARAARKFQEEMLGDPNLRTWTREDEAAARGRLMDEELRARKSHFGALPKRDPAVLMDFRDI
ncbi:hypothetical protein [Cloacibacillus porcorum]|jgi:hypothetical protein|uniref:hypothetical protein n=1 Tax=Cloacibacillus porcorum TaxID=1197717 RepID=UPI001459D8A0|nr:hypothetical protein [Cloacibacillus porcorum]NMF18600.1 phage tail protein [Cloacibacillus porcorum]